MVKLVIVGVIFLYSASLSVFCQKNDSVPVVQRKVTVLPVDSVAHITKETDLVVQRVDTVHKAEIKNDTVRWVEGDMEVNKSTENLLASMKPFKPDPTKAVIYSAIFPGLGQIYNRKYWKLPIVYGGFLGFVYAITWNGRLYGDYTDGYRAIMKDDFYTPENSRYWTIFFNEGVIEEYDLEHLDGNTLNKWREAIRSRRDFHRRNRDLSIIGTVALYALCMIDAYVDAQLFDFDISPNLSFRVEPRIELDAFSQKSIWVQCSIKF